jgi:hypothetical protein
MTNFEIATEQDNSELRRLLRENSMQSWVSMSIEREPSFCAGQNKFGQDWAVIAREGAATVGMYTCASQPVHVNGLAGHLGYLGALRVNPSYRNQLRVLRDGYASLRYLSQGDQPESWYTCIASENQTARRILEANLKGMPAYKPVGEMTTFALPRSRGRSHALWSLALPEQMNEVCDFYNQHAAQWQFAPVLTPEAAQLTGATFYIHVTGDRIKACMALWNQQSYKQIVARAYRRPLATLVPVYNACARLARMVELPAVGENLDQTFLSFLAAPLEQPELFMDLVSDAVALCPSKALTLGLNTQHPYARPIQREFRPLVYRTQVYTVGFDGVPALDGRPAQPEVAVL